MFLLAKPVGFTTEFLEFGSAWFDIVMPSVHRLQFLGGDINIPWEDLVFRVVFTSAKEIKEHLVG